MRCILLPLFPSGTLNGGGSLLERVKFSWIQHGEQQAWLDEEATRPRVKRNSIECVIVYSATVGSATSTEEVALYRSSRDYMR